MARFFPDPSRKDPVEFLGQTLIIVRLVALRMLCDPVVLWPTSAACMLGGILCSHRYHGAMWTSWRSTC